MSAPLTTSTPEASSTAAPVSCPTPGGQQGEDTTRTTCPSNMAKEAGIGAGVGLPLATALAVAIGLLIRERKRGNEGAGVAGRSDRGSAVGIQQGMLPLLAMTRT